jgi:transcriptional regulator of arginine metabolism
MKYDRQALLRQLIQQGSISSQQDAVAALEAHGYSATQATVSRDLHEIGAVRARSNGDIRYVLGEETQRSELSLGRVFKEFVLQTATSGSMIVIHTPPGYASVVASALDKSGITEILGVVAGDDTLFVCCDEEVGAQRTLLRILDLVREDI